MLQHATCNASKHACDPYETDESNSLLGRLLGDERLGKIAPNAFADVLVLDSNPLADVTILDRPEDHLLAVIKGGRVVSSKFESLKAETW